MKRIFRYALPVVSVVLLGAGQAQARGPHDGDRIGLASSAHQFERAAKRMHYVLSNTIGRAHVTNKARQLTRAAHHYRRAVRRGKPARYLKQEFHGLARYFDDFRRQLRHSDYVHHDRRTRHAMRRLGRSFHELRLDTRDSLRTHRGYRKDWHYSDHDDCYRRRPHRGYRKEWHYSDHDDRYHRRPHRNVEVVDDSA